MGNHRDKKILRVLGELYPDPQSELNFKNKYQLLISVVLSAQCTDKKVNQVTPTLFKAYPNFKQLGNAKLSEVEKIIRPINYYKTKSKNLIKLGQMVTTEYRGRIPESQVELVKLPGVGNKTASVVVSELGTEKALPVDTHVFRVSKRLGLAEGKNTDQVSEELKQRFPEDSWRELHHWLIFHGRRVCSARNPRCGECSLAELCNGKPESA